MMVAREDETPLAHDHWLASHIPGAQLVTVGGGHLGPRDKEEELMAVRGDTRRAGFDACPASRGAQNR